MKKFLVALGVVLFIGFVLINNPSEMAQSLMQVNLGVFIWSPVLSLIILFTLTIRFKLVLKGVSDHKWSFWNLFRMFTISNLFALISPAKSGELVKGYFLKRQGVDYGKGLLVVVIERVIDFVSISLLIIVFAVLSSSYAIENSIIYGSLLLTLMMISILFLRSGYFIKLLRKMPLLSKKFKEAEEHGYNKMLKKSLSPNQMTKPTLVSLLAVVLIAARMYIIFISLGIHPNFFVVIFVYLLVIVVGILSMIPGGLGSAELTGEYLYPALLGVDMTTVAVALILLRISTFAIDIPVGLISSYFHKDKKN